MRRRIYWMCFSIFFGIASNALAGMNLPAPKGRKKKPTVKLPVPRPALSGFYVDFGISINPFTTENNNIIADGSVALKPPTVKTPTQLSSFILLPYGDVDNSGTTIAPTFAVGWWSKPIQYDSDHQVFWGAELLYKYLDITKIGKTSLVTDSSSQGFVKNTLGNEVALLGNLAVRLSQKVTSIFGVGVAVFPTVQSSFYINHPNRTAEEKTLYGGIGQAGLLYQLSKVWFLNFTYAYVATGSSTFHQPGSSHDVKLSLNQFMIMLDYHFREL